MNDRLDQLGWSLRKLEAETGDRYKNIQNWLRQDVRIPVEFVARFIAHVPVNPDWLMFGRGESARVEPSVKERAFDIVAAFMDEVRAPSPAAAEHERQMVMEGLRAIGEAEERRRQQQQPEPRRRAAGE